MEKKKWNKTHTLIKTINKINKIEVADKHVDGYRASWAQTREKQRGTLRKLLGKPVKGANEGVTQNFDVSDASNTSLAKFSTR